MSNRSSLSTDGTLGLPGSALEQRVGGLDLLLFGGTTMATKHSCGGPHFGHLAPAGDCARCDELRNGAAPVSWKQRFSPCIDQSRRTDNRGTCNHGTQNLNPGGYCMICGAGRDYS
jgi:hypothetical protein